MFESIPLGEIAKIEMGQSPDSNYVHDGLDDGLPFLQGNAEFGELNPSAKYSCSAPMKKCSEGDILISVRAPVGEINIADRSYCIGRGLAAISFSDISPNIAGKLIEAVRYKLRVVAQGSTFEAINKNDLLNLLVAWPGSKELQALDSIFTAIDTQIRQTEAIIDKLQQVKQGLLHDLLTRGIDANGQLRPPRDQAPELYKESPLGWIPREWDIRGVLDVAPSDRQCILTGPFGADLGQADFRNEGVPVLRIGNVQTDYIDWSDTLFVTAEKAKKLEKYCVRAGDLLFARQGATTGRNALADERANGALINYHIIRVAIDHEKCHPMYLYSLFNSATAKSQVDQLKGRGTREGINSEQIASFAFALPPVGEQKEVVTRVKGISGSISDESLVLKKLRLRRSGLIDDLLNGRVRVTKLLQSA